MNRTSIEWTHFSSNPLKYRDAAGRVVWGCVHASPGCLNCYSEAQAKRYRRGGPFNVPTMNGLTPFLDAPELHHMRTAKRVGGRDVAGSMCFIGDMTDIFGEWVPDDLLNQLFSNVLELRRDVTWQVLTKRADRMLEYLSWRYGEGRIPPRHIWFGVSVEDQKHAELRIPLLVQTPARVRFVSYEPAIGPVDFMNIEVMGHSLDALRGEWCSRHSGCLVDDKGDGSVDWVIVGGESGPRARPCAMEWVESIVQQCRAAALPVFVKQLGSYVVSEGRACDSADEMRDLLGQDARWPDHRWLWRAGLRDHKGGDPDEWPEEYRVREFPLIEVPA